MADAVERTLVLKFAPDLSAVDSALTGLEQRASRAISFGTGGGGSTFSAEGPAIGGGPAPVPGAPLPSPGAGGFRPARNADVEGNQIARLKEQAALVGLDPGQRVQYFQGQVANANPGLDRARSDLQLARAEEALKRAKEREAAAAERSAAAEERRAAASQRASARGYAADDRAYQREFAGRRSAIADALDSGGGGPKGDLDAIADAAGEAEEGSAAAPARTGRGRGRRFNPGRGLYRFIGPYFIAQEGLRVANANLDYRDDSALARNDDERLAAATKYNQSLLSIPIAGQGYELYRNLTGQSRDEKLAMRQLEEAKADDEAASREFGQRRESAATIDSVQRRSLALGLPSSFGRQKLDIKNQYEDWHNQEQDRIEGLKRASEEAGLAPQERSRREQEYRSQNALFGRQDTARQGLAVGQYGTIVRELNEKLQDLGLAEPGLRARLEGRYGIAREQDFEGGLRQRELEAYRYSNVYGRAVAAQNPERRRIEQDEITEGVTERGASTAETQALLGRRPSRAASLRFEEERRLARRDARSPEDEQSRLANIQGREDLDAQQRNDQIFSFSAGIRSRNDALSFQLGNTTDPRGIRNLLGASRSAANDTLLAALAAGQGGQAGAIPDILKGGVLGLQLQQRNYVQGFETTEADPRRSNVTGEGAADVGKVLQDIANDIKALKNAGTTLDQIKTTIQQRLGVAL